MLDLKPGHIYSIEIIWTIIMFSYDLNHDEISAKQTYINIFIYSHDILTCEIKNTLHVLKIICVVTIEPPSDKSTSINYISIIHYIIYILTKINNSMGRTHIIGITTACLQIFDRHQIKFLSLDSTK